MLCHFSVVWEFAVQLQEGWFFSTFVFEESNRTIPISYWERRTKGAAEFLMRCKQKLGLSLFRRGKHCLWNQVLV